MPTEAELKEKIKRLKALGEDEAAEKYEAELAAMKRKGSAISSSSGADFAISEDDWDAAKSKFATPGTHLSEFGIPDWDTPGKSIKLPFTIIDGGPSDGVESKISTGIGPASVGILKQYLTALGITPTFPITLAKLQEWVPGKKALTYWVERVDDRPGGKGTVYTKATAIFPVGGKVEEEEIM